MLRYQSRGQHLQFWAHIVVGADHDVPGIAGAPLQRTQSPRPAQGGDQAGISSTGTSMQGTYELADAELIATWQRHSSSKNGGTELPDANMWAGT